MAFIMTIFRPDGSKQRRPVGYGGGLCHEATKPYEKRDVPGSITVTPTEEAGQEPREAVAETEQLRQG